MSSYLLILGLAFGATPGSACESGDYVPHSGDVQKMERVADPQGKAVYVPSKGSGATPRKLELEPEVTREPAAAPRTRGPAT